MIGATELQKQDFPDSVKEWGGFPLVSGTGNFAEDKYFNQVMETWGGVTLNIQTFFEAKNNIL